MCVLTDFFFNTSWTIIALEKSQWLSMAFQQYFNFRYCLNIILDVPYKKMKPHVHPLSRNFVTVCLPCNV